jgi:adenylate cyclase
MPALARRSGRLVKLTGDGALVEFPSAIDALSAAIEFQQAMAEANCDQPEHSAVTFRVGVHLGDLIVDGDDLYGDSVNVAARLEAAAPAGGIVVSSAVNEAIAGRLKAAFRDLGPLALKNIERPVSAYGIEWNPTEWKTAAAGATTVAKVAPPPLADSPLALPDKPSI